MTITAWYMDDCDGDQRLPHKTEPLQPVAVEDLDALGVLRCVLLCVHRVVLSTLNIFMVQMNSLYYKQCFV